MVPVKAGSGWRYHNVREVEASDEAGAILAAATRCVVTYELELAEGSAPPTLVYLARWSGDLP